MEEQVSSYEQLSLYLGPTVITILIIVLIIALIIEIIMLGVVARMARARGDNAGSWVLVGWFTGWIIAVIILAISGHGKKEEPTVYYANSNGSQPAKQVQGNVATPTAVAKDSVWVCSKCGKKVNKEYEYCPWCLTKK